MSNVSSVAVNEGDEHFAHENAESLGKNAESSSSPSIESRVPRKKCLCGLEAPMKTSLTKDNYGRRFLGCANYKVKQILIMYLFFGEFSIWGFCVFAN
jgi:hypothetical protein